MAVNPVVVKLNNTSHPAATKVVVGKAKWCFGKLTFGASDTYPSAGIDIQALVRKLFGVQNIVAILFMGTSSDATASTNYSHVLARYVFTPQIKDNDTQAGVIRLFAVGRIIGPAVEPSETELANGDSINALSFPFWAICEGDGATYDSQMGPN